MVKFQLVHLGGLALLCIPVYGFYRYEKRIQYDSVKECVAQRYGYQLVRYI